MWSAQNTLNLIEDLLSTPCLWDVQCPEYKNRNKKVDAFDILSKKYNVSPGDIEKKVQALKTQFRREHKKLADSKRSGSSLKRANWFGYEALLFLLQGNECRGSRSIDYVEEQSEKESALPLSDSESEGNTSTDNKEGEKSNNEENMPKFRTPEPKRSKKSLNEDPKVKEVCQCMKTLSETVSRRDEYSVYGEHIANKLRNCGRSKIEIAIAQHQIDDICFNLTMGAYCRQPNSSSYRSHQSPNSVLTIAAGSHHYDSLSSLSNSPSSQP